MCYIPSHSITFKKKKKRELKLLFTQNLALPLNLARECLFSVHKGRELSVHSTPYKEKGWKKRNYTNLLHQQHCRFESEYEPPCNTSHFCKRHSFNKTECIIIRSKGRSKRKMLKKLYYYILLGSQT